MSSSRSISYRLRRRNPAGSGAQQPHTIHLATEFGRNSAEYIGQVSGSTAERTLVTLSSTDSRSVQHSTSGEIGGS